MKRKDDRDRAFVSHISQYRFGVYKRKYYVDGHEVDHCMIVLRDVETGLIKKFTNFADYAIYSKFDDKSFSITGIDSVYTAAAFLNFVFVDNWPKYKITRISQITVMHARDYLMYFADKRTRSGGYPSHERVCEKRKQVSRFLIALIREGKSNIREEEIVNYHFVKNRKDSLNGRFVPRYLIPIQYHDSSRGYKQLYRDMPLALADRLITMAETYDPEIAFALTLQLYVGLRSGEVCNIRQNTSVFGPCFRLTYGDDFKMICTAIEIDLSKEYPLRSDGVSTGRIKKERKQGVFSLFVPEVESAYRRHLDLIRNKPVESSMPMFLCRHPDRKSGKYMAMTNSGYRDRVQRLFYKHVLPSCRDDADPYMRAYYEEMQGHTWGTHGCRHWYTVSLVLNGVDNVAELMTYRGDRSPRSAMVYLERKGELNRRYAKAANKFGKMIRQ